MTPYTRRLFIDAASLSLSFSTALVAYFLSTFAGSLIGTRFVDALFSIAALATLLLLAPTVRLMASIGRGRTAFWAAFLHFGSLVGFALPLPRPVLLPVFLLYQMTLVGTFFGLDVVLEKYSSDQVTGTIRGRHLAILNLGWIPAPVVAGWIMSHYGFPTLSLIAALFVLPVACILGSWFYGRGVGVTVRGQGMLESLAIMLKKKPLRYALAIAFLLQVFYAIMVVETPLVLHGLGFSLERVGIMFAIMLVPFVLLQYPLGRLADEQIGEKEIVITGFFVTGISTLGIAIISGSVLAASFFFWTALLFITRIGAASIEVMRDAYFFKHVDSRDLHIIALLWSAMPLAYVVAPVISNVLVRSTGSYASVFGLLGLILFAFAVLATRMPDTK